jgi:DNA-binding transcriptional LysR family regulator
MHLSASTLASLRFFEATSRLLSFKLAARELHVTEGAVSQRIKHLEQALGCTLFCRLPRHITLTEQGHRFAFVVKRALEDIEREARAINATNANVETRIRVGPSFAIRWLIPRLGEFYAQNPQLKLFIFAAHGYFDPSQREFDLAIEMLNVKYSNLHSEPLMDEYLIPVCTSAYLQDNGFPGKPADLTRCTLLHDANAWVGAESDAEWRHWLNEVGAADVDSKQGQFFSLSNMSIEAALSNQGIAMGRASLVKQLLECGQLIAPFKFRIKSPANYCLLYPNELAHRPEIKAVSRWLHHQARRTST